MNDMRSFSYASAVLDPLGRNWQNEDDMAWASPQYPRARVNWAGNILVSPVQSEGDWEEALQIINNWRASHSFPLNTFQMTLRNKARQVAGTNLVAQRIKRLSSIAYKLVRFPTMKLIQMQDIGGCRAVVPNVRDVDALRTLYHDSDLKHRLVREDDYIRRPRTSGYRGIHLVYRYVSDKKETYNSLQIEMQLRSRLQHSWATAVETVGTFLQQSLKASQGSGRWLRFFALMGSAIALRERTAIVPGTPALEPRLLRELGQYVRRLEVRKKLQAYGETLQTLQTLEKAEMRGTRYFLLELQPSEGKLTVSGFADNELERATSEYLRVERSLKGPGAEAVLVSVESLDSLRRAYPNYFLDTHLFLEAVDAAIS